MTWQKKARVVIVGFVVLFVAIVFVASRRRTPAPAAEALPTRVDPAAVVEGHGTGTIEQSRDGHVVFSLKFGSQLTYPDGRSKLTGGVSVTSDRDGRPFTVTSREADVGMQGSALQTAHFMGDVQMTSGDLKVGGGEASYSEGDGIVKIPGPATFSRGRMQGSGVGATYDRNREVLWLLDQARITVTPDKGGQGALVATAKAAGMARLDNYIKLTGGGHLEADARVIDADEITIMLTPATKEAPDQHVQQLHLRGNSRITGGPDAGAAQAMSARDIDLIYAPDGRTLQHAQLVENAVLQLPGEARAAGRRIAGKTIALEMAPDGSTVTTLTAADNVQVDLPADGDQAAKRIRSATLTANGAAGAGLEHATFAGGVEYRESRPARGAAAALERLARSQSMVVDTKPGFGAVQQADFHGNVHFTDGPTVTADATRALYHVDRDQIELSSTPEPGPASPRVSDGRVTVEARAIEMTLGTRKLTADTKVRSSMLPESTSKPAAAKPADSKPAAGLPPVAPVGPKAAPRPAARGAAPAPAPEADAAHLPGILKGDQPVTVTSNRLAYDGAAGHAVYSGSARLWQGDTSVRGDTIIVDDSSGNIEAHTNTHTEMMMDEVDKTTGVRSRTRSIGEAEAFVYDDAKRLATYTGKAHIIGPEGDVVGERIELFLKRDANELERAEGYGANGSVVVKETGRTATGARLTYTAEDETYVMTGTPVVAIETAPPDCKKSVGAVLTFQRAVGTVSTAGNGVIRSVQNQIACPAEVK